MCIYIYTVAMVMTGFILNIHLIKIHITYNHGQLVYMYMCMSAIHLLMFGSLFMIYPSSLRLLGNKLLTSRCISAPIHLLAMVYNILHKHKCVYVHTYHICLCVL